MILQMGTEQWATLSSGWSSHYSWQGMQVEESSKASTGKLDKQYKA